MTATTGKAIVIITLWGCLAGCIPAAAVYAVSRHRTHRTYHAYVTDMEKSNQMRQQQGLAPLPIAAFKEWKKEGKPSGKTLDSEAPAPVPEK